MKRYIGIIIIVALIITSIPFYVLASDISDADFYGQILVSNTGAAVSYVGTVMTLSSPNLISAGYVDADFDGCAIRTAAGSDAYFMPGYSTNPWCIYVPYISANSSTYYTLYTSPTADFGATKYYFPSTSSMTVTDDPSMELSNNDFDLEIKGIFDTRVAAGYPLLIAKPDEPPNGEISFFVTTVDTIGLAINDDAHELTAHVTSGNHTFNIIRDGANLHIYVDGVSENSTNIGGATSITDSGDDWEFAQYPGVVALEHIKFEIAGVQKFYVKWEYGPTFTDLSGSGNTATPSFRTTSSDADVTANLTSFSPINPAKAPSTSVTSPGDFYTGNISTNAPFSSDNVSPSDVPGYGVIKDVTTDAGLPTFWLWGILSSCMLASVGIGLSYARRKYGISGGYVTAVIIGIALLFGFLITTGVFDWWMLWYFAILGSGIAVASRHIDLGGSTSQHAWIGFLATTFIILTLINRVMEGYLLTSAETSFLNDVSFTQAFNVLGVFTMPILNFSFFTEGIPALLRWDYLMFGGQAQIIQYLLYSFTAVVSFIIFIIVIGLVYSFFSRIR